MRNNYLIYRNIEWISSNSCYPPLKMRGIVKLFINKMGMPDKRRKEYKQLMKEMPRYYFGISADVDIEK